MTETMQRVPTVADCRALVHAARVSLLAPEDQQIAVGVHPQFLFSLYPSLGQWHYIAERLRHELEQVVEVSDGSFIVPPVWYYKSVQRTVEETERNLTSFSTLIGRYLRQPQVSDAARKQSAEIVQHANASHQLVFGPDADPATYDMVVLVDRIYSGLEILCVPDVIDDAFLEVGLLVNGEAFYRLLQERIDLVSWVLDQYPAIRKTLNRF